MLLKKFNIFANEIQYFKKKRKVIEMKKISVFFLCLILAVSLVGCGASNDMAVQDMEFSSEADSAGGIFYTIGAWFYAKKGFRYHHLVWHLLINLAVLCHFVGIVFFLN